MKLPCRHILCSFALFAYGCPQSSTFEFESPDTPSHPPSYASPDASPTTDAPDVRTIQTANGAVTGPRITSDAGGTILHNSENPFPNHHQETGTTPARTEEGVLSNELLSFIDSRSSNEPIEIGIYLTGLSEWQPENLRSMSDQQREDAIAERQEYMVSFVSTFAESYEGPDFGNIDYIWPTGMIILHMTPGDIISTSKEPGISLMILGDNGQWTSSDTQYSGDQFSDESGAHELAEAGYSGEDIVRYNRGFDGSGNVSPVRIGFSDAGLPRTFEAGFMEPGWADTRWRAVYECGAGSSCQQVSRFNAGRVSFFSGGYHGHLVAATAASSIIDGQNATVATASDREERSHGAHYASLFFYASDTDGNADYVAAGRNAILMALQNGIDVLNFSWNNSCDSGNDMTGYCGGMKHMLQWAHRYGGMVLTAAAGNTTSGIQQQPGVIFFPATSTATLTIGGIDVVGTTSYESQHHWSGSLIGPARGGENNEVRSPVIDLVAPRNPQLVSGVGGTYISPIGTSFSAPAVAGLTAMTMDMLSDIGHAHASEDPMILYNVMRAMGDRYHRSFFGNAIKSTNSVSSWSGFGRSRVHTVDQDGMGQMHGFGSHSTVLQENDLWTLPVGGSSPEDSSITGWKWAMSWEEASMPASTATVERYVVDTCPPGPDFVALIDADTSSVPVKMAYLPGSAMHGRCIEMWMYVADAPPQGVRVATADYFYSGGTTPH